MNSRLPGLTGLSLAWGTGSDLDRIVEEVVVETGASRDQARACVEKVLASVELVAMDPVPPGR